jgi:hypothetical protein
VRRREGFGWNPDAHATPIREAHLVSGNSEMSSEIV